MKNLLHHDEYGIPCLMWVMLLAFIAVCLSPSLAFAVDEPRQNGFILAVLSITSDSGDEQSRRLLINACERQFFSIPIFTVITREQLEDKFGPALAIDIPCFSGNLVTRLRKTFNPGFLVCGSLESQQGKNILTLKIIDAKSGSVVSEVKQGCRRCSPEQLIRAMEQVTRSLMRTFLEERRDIIRQLFPELSFDELMQSLRSPLPFRGERPLGPTTDATFPSPTAGTEEDLSSTVPQSSGTSVGEEEPREQPLQTSVAVEATPAQGDDEHIPPQKASPDVADGDTRIPPAEAVSIIDVQKATEEYQRKRRSILFALIGMLAIIIGGIVVLNVYRYRRRDIRSSSHVTSLAEIEESERPGGILRCTIRNARIEIESYIFAAPHMVIGFDARDIYDERKPHANLASRPASEETTRKLSRIDRRHARIDFGPSALFITDLGSTNGTFVNNTRLEPGTRLSLEDKDEINFAAQVNYRVAIHRDSRQQLSAAFLQPPDDASVDVSTIVCLVMDCFFTVDVNTSFMWSGSPSEDSLFKLYMKNNNFWVQSLAKYPPIMLDGERMSEFSKRRLDRLHSKIEIHETLILIDDLTTSL